MSEIPRTATRLTSASAVTTVTSASAVTTVTAKPFDKDSFYKKINNKGTEKLRNIVNNKTKIQYTCVICKKPTHKTKSAPNKGPMMRCIYFSDCRKVIHEACYLGADAKNFDVKPNYTCPPCHVAHQ